MSEFADRSQHGGLDVVKSAASDSTCTSRPVRGLEGASVPIATATISSSCPGPYSQNAGHPPSYGYGQAPPPQFPNPQYAQFQSACLYPTPVPTGMVQHGQAGGVVIIMQGGLTAGLVPVKQSFTQHIVCACFVACSALACSGSSLSYLPVRSHSTHYYDFFEEYHDWGHAIQSSVS